MLRTIALSAGLALLTATAGAAQTIGGPAELPPGSYEGQMYVDSRGCVFLRAGFGGQVTWVPRVTSARKPLCGYPPLLGPRVRVEVAEASPTAPPAITATTVVPAAPPAQMSKPMAVASAPPRSSYVPAVPQAAPRKVVATRHLTRASTPARRIGCFASAPVPVRVTLTTGGTVVVCTTGDGSLNGARPPIYPAGSPPGAAFGDHGRIAAVEPHPLQHRTAPAGSASVPEGYKLAWEDGRLNPLRGQGTAAGQTAQDRIWTRTVPAKAVKPPRTTPAVRRTEAATISAKAPPAEASTAIYVQAGSFGKPSNAIGAAARLSALGLPVAQSRAGAGRLQVVLAGPFRDAGAAARALGAVRRAGFGDAFLRR